MYCSITKVNIFNFIIVLTITDGLTSFHFHSLLCTLSYSDTLILISECALQVVYSGIYTRFQGGVITSYIVSPPDGVCVYNINPPDGAVLITSIHQMVLC